MLSRERKEAIDQKLDAISEELTAMSKEVGAPILLNAHPDNYFGLTVFCGEDESTHYIRERYEWSKGVQERAMTLNRETGRFEAYHGDILKVLTMREEAADE